MKKKRTAMRLIKEVLIYIVAFTVLSLAVDFYRKRNMPAIEAPQISGISNRGERIDVIEMSKEKPVIVYFWATWCVPCKFVSPTISWLSDSEDYEVVSVSIGSGSDERVSRFIEAHEYKFSNINDSRGLFGSEWGISVTPTIAIVKNGQIESVTTGMTTPVGVFARAWLANQ